MSIHAHGPLRVVREAPSGRGFMFTVSLACGWGQFKKKNEQEAEEADDHHGAKTIIDTWSPREQWRKLLQEVLALDDRISAEKRKK